MSTYKVIQDIEAEDKLVGPLSLRQFIYAAVAAVSGYLCYLSVAKNVGYLLIVSGPIFSIAAFFAFPWKGEQSTEIWALAKIRFLVKPRVRIWNQSGIKDYLVINARKKVTQTYTRNFAEGEVESRLKALADTIDSRGWAVKNASAEDIHRADPLIDIDQSDRLVALGDAPQDGLRSVLDLDQPGAESDILDENNAVAQNFAAMMDRSAAERHQRLIDQTARQFSEPVPAMPAATVAQMPATGPGGDVILPPAAPSAAPIYEQPASQQWFVQPPAYPGTANATGASPYAAIPQPVAPPMDEAALSEQLKAQKIADTAVSMNHLRVIQPPGQAGPQAMQHETTPFVPPPAAAAEPAVASQPDPAILEYATNDDLDVATIARQVNKEIRKSPDEVEIRLH